ncbi:hypothetical protein GCM10009841_33020 [Microlunatus panaciterrae]|uniref:Flavodoxin-like domain-containing protein n=1 Tax=Microlunatus panaciterrae TaxID=400768 RepID=A0ABS2RG29_9ACTN|nr:hypothetical protein [Microlunatus panaciterrae]MBM7797960.1 hypothetical protein [Microlunatus panaciterrae]
MHAVVVYESMFGDTQQVAEAVAAGMTDEMTVEVVEVSDAPHQLASDIDLLVIGAPSHAFSVSREHTRGEHAPRGQVSSGCAVREWLETLQHEGDVPFVAFDTKAAQPGLPGSATHAADRRLQLLGFQRLAPAETFFVSGVAGSLVTGEVARATRWGKVLARKVTQRLASASAGHEEA